MAAHQTPPRHKCGEPAKDDHAGMDHPATCAPQGAAAARAAHHGRHPIWSGLVVVAAGTGSPADPTSRQTLVKRTTCKRTGHLWTATSLPDAFVPRAWHEGPPYGSSCRCSCVAPFFYCNRSRLIRCVRCVCTFKNATLAVACDGAGRDAAIANTRSRPFLGCLFWGVFLGLRVIICPAYQDSLGCLNAH